MKKIKLFEQFLNEAKYSAWTMPDRKMLAQEYRVEHEKKGRRDFATEEEFVDAVTNADIVEVDMRMYRKIGNRSGTNDFVSLNRLISTYASYPKYRNEDTLKDM
jgi:bisphosphoglycerate-dependent phosphoglycerate mutase